MVWRSRRVGVRVSIPFVKNSKAVFLGLAAFVIAVGTLYVPNSLNADAALPGTNWTQHSATSVTKYWSDIASSADGTKLVALAGDDYVYTSTNSGESWTQRSPAGAGVIKRWRTVASSADGTKLVIAADNDYVYTSTDSGATWTPRDPAGETKVWYSVASSDDGMTILLGVGADYVYISTDGGATWEQKSPAGARTWSSTAVSSNGEIMFTGNDSGYIYKSIDTGETWTQVNPAGAPRYWNDIAISSDANQLVAVARNDYVYTSEDSGETWTQNIISGSTQPWRSAAISANGAIMYVGSGNGHIYTSIDTGATWTQRDPASGAREWNGIAVSSNGEKAAAVALTDYVYTSTDTGATWTQRDPVKGFRDWTAIASSADGMRLIAAAESDYLYTSTDSGETWTQRRPIDSGTRSWADVAMSANGSRILAVSGYSNEAFTSDDGGVTWVRRANYGVGSSKSLQSAAISSDGRKMAYSTGDGYVYISDDYGETWTDVSPSGVIGFPISAVAMSADGSKMLATYRNNPSRSYTYTSSDGGLTWTANTDAGLSSGWRDAAMSADGQRMIVGNNGGYLHISDDGGATWTERQPKGNVTGDWRAITVSSDGMRIMAADYGPSNGSGAYVYTSVDGGISWTQRDPDGGPRAWRGAASSASGHRLFLAAFNDYIYTSGGSYLPTVDPSEISVMGGEVNLVGECSVTNDTSFISVVSQGSTTHAISYDGVVYSWGDNTGGLFGDGTMNSSDVPVAIDTSGVLAGKTVSKVVRTTDTAYALTSDGMVYAWGAAGASGQLGDGSGVGSLTPVAVDTSGVLAGKMILQVVAAGNTAYALASDGTVYAWGDNMYGQLGNNSTASAYSPVAVDTSGVLAGKTIRQIAAMGGTAYAVASDGTVYSWGRNDHGQLGNGGVIISPTWTQRDPTGANAIRYWHGAAMSADGNTIAAIAQYANPPVYVSADGGETWTPRNTGLPGGVAYTDIKMSADGQTLIVTIQGNYVWTSTNGGVNWTQRTPAGAGVTKNWNVAAMSSDGSKMVVAADNDYVYTSGDGGATWTQRDPGGVTGRWQGLTISDDGTKLYAGSRAGATVYFSVDSGATWTANSPRSTSGGAASWARMAATSDGTKVMTASADNSYEGYVYTTTNAGTGSPATWIRHEPAGAGWSSWFGVAMSADGTKMMAGKDANQGYVYTSADSGATWTGHSSLPSGYWRALAMSADGEKMVAANFGQNTSGGYIYTYPTVTSGNVDSSVPVAVDMSGALSGKSVSQIVTGYQTAYALTADREVYSWGDGDDGQLGDGTNADSNVPVAVDTSGALSGKTIRQVFTNDFTAFVVTADGAAYAWGFGQLGDGSGNSSDVPVAVAGALTGKNITQILGNNRTNYALASDGSVYAWGGNASGQLGNNDSNDSLVPVAVYTGDALASKFVVDIAANSQLAAYALASDGSLYSWGSNNRGMLGNGTTGGSSNVPVAVKQSVSIANIMINSKAATNITSPDGCTVSFTAPPNDPGTYDVVVNYGDGTSITIPQSLTYVEPFIQMYLYGDNLIKASPFYDGGEGTTQLQATVVTNDVTGYTVSLNAVGTTNLTCSEAGRGGDTVPARSGSGSSLTDDTWAYGLGTAVSTPTTWDGITTTATTFDSYGTDTAGRTHHLYFGAKVTLGTTPCNSYDGDILLTATTNWGAGP